MLWAKCGMASALVAPSTTPPGTAGSIDDGGSPSKRVLLSGWLSITLIIAVLAVVLAVMLVAKKSRKQTNDEAHRMHPNAAYDEPAAQAASYVETCVGLNIISRYIYTQSNRLYNNRRLF